MSTINQEELKHYGVKGMKWGVRRYQPYTSGSLKGKFEAASKKASSSARGAASKVSSSVKSGVKKAAKRTTSTNERLLKKSKSYQQDYAEVRRRGMSHDRALKAARASRIVRQALAVSAAKDVANVVYRKNYRNIYLGKQAAESFRRVVVKPRAAAFGKNIVNTLTGNPVKSIVNPPKGMDVTSALYKGMSMVVQN